MVGPRGATKLQPPQYENASYGTAKKLKGIKTKRHQWTYFAVAE